MLHYNFPPFSVGEVSFLRGPGRREIGHGALAERALAPVMPDRGAVPVHGPRRLGHPRVERLVVDGLGLRRLAGDDGRGRAARRAGRRRGDGPGDERGATASTRSLSDIAGAEDHYGDMDFKVAGTGKGITALQMDIKVVGHHDGRSCARRSSRRCRAGCSSSARWPRRSAAPRTDVSTFAPRIVSIKIPVDKIRDVIGPGGKMIRSIIERTGVKIDVEDDGRVNVASTDEASAAKAIAIIQELTATAELNKTYLGKVQRITDFGAFVEILPGVDGLLHVSEIAAHRVKDVRDELKEGEQLMVKVINVDPSGKIRLSRKALLQDQGGQPAEAVAGPGDGSGPREHGHGPRRRHNK